MLFMSRKPQQIDESLLYVQPMMYRHIPDVARIAFDSFTSPWPIQALEHGVDGAYMQSFVAWYRGELAAYAITEVSDYSKQITNLAVAPRMRRKHIGTQLVNRLIDKLGTKPFMSLMVEVPEPNLSAQLFFKSCGFECISTLNNHFTNGDDAYVFQYRVGDRNRRKAVNCG